MVQDTELLREIKDIQILIRTNNLLLSRFILELSRTRKELGLPKRVFGFKFELLEDDYKQLVNEFTEHEVQKALYRLDRLLLTNKQQCPNNIAKYIRKRINKSRFRKEQREKYARDNNIN